MLKGNGMAKKVLMAAMMMAGCVAAAVPPVKKGPLINGPAEVKKPVAAPAKKPAAAPAKKPAAEPAKKPAAAPAKKPSTAPVKKPATPTAKKTLPPTAHAKKPPVAKKAPTPPEEPRPMPATAPRAPYRGAIAVDARSGRVLFADGERTTGYPASCTKLMTLLLVLEDLRDGRYRLSDRAVASPYAASMEPSKVDIRPGQSMTIEDLLYALMMKSANDGAVVLAEHAARARAHGPATPEETPQDRVAAFVARMNRRAQELGMRDTRYASPNGLPPPRGSKRGFDVSTAYDLARLGRALVSMPEVFAYTSRASHTVTGGGGQPISFQNHNYFVPRNRDPQHLASPIPECDGLKTGYTAASGSSIVLTAARNGRRVVVVVLGSAGRHEREAAAGRILRDALDAVSIW